MADEKRLSRLSRRARALDGGAGAVKAAQAARRLLPGDAAYGVSRKRFFRAKGAPKDLQVFSVKPRAATA